MIYITCPDCAADTPRQARAMLATLDLGESLGPLGQLSWACLCCGRLVTAAREVAHLLRRITVSVSLLDDGFGSDAVEDDTDSSAPPRPHAEQPGAGPPFSWQDVLTLHELPETDAWIEHIAEPPQSSSWAHPTISIRQATTLAPAAPAPNHRAGAENGDHVGVEVASGSPIGRARYCDRRQG